MSPPTHHLPALLDTAESLAASAGEITLRYFGGMLASATKGDGTPVTAADRAVELHLRREIGSRFPSHGILGEEYGEENPGAEIRWILDPIDGTRTFMRGVPLFGVLIGVEVEGEPSIGVVHMPAIGETVSAALGQGCRWNGSPARVSEVGRLDEPTLLTSDPTAFRDTAMARGWDRLVREAAMVRSWGDCYGHLLVATGRAEVMVFTDSEGRARSDRGSGISTNDRLHEEVLEILTS
jgi:histidinol phosphatase-like enzyme (inositol monophosphatase family)